jgi:hypothetical protein
MDRRTFLAAGVTTIAAGAVARSTLGAVDHALAAAGSRRRYRWRPGADWGGGFVNVGAADGDHLAVIGDMWGACRSKNGGRSWRATNWGAPSIPTGRAIAFSKRPSTRGWAFVGIGPAKDGIGAGYFGVLSPKGHIRQVDWSPHGFGTDISDANRTVPRPCGQLIDTDYDARSKTEYIYAAAPNGLTRYRNDDDHPLDSSHLAPVRLWQTQQAWKAILLVDRDHLLMATFTRDARGASQTPKVFLVSDIRRRATFREVTYPNVAVNALRKIGDTVYAASSQGVYRIEDPLATTQRWTRLGGDFFDRIPMDICGRRDTLYVGQADGALNLPLGHAIAKSTDAGRSWRWVSSNVRTTHYRSDERWWQSTFENGLLDGDAYDTSQMAYSNGKVYVFGRKTAWVSPNEGRTWYPSCKGMNGSSSSRVVIDGNTVNRNDEDWGAVVSTDGFETCHAGDVVQYPSASLNRTVDGHAYRIVQGVPCDITRDGVSVADDVFRSWAVTGNISDMAVSSDGTIYVVQSGGGLYVGEPV